jgi:hypothetical protein
VSVEESGPSGRERARARARPMVPFPPHHPAIPLFRHDPHHSIDSAIGAAPQPPLGPPDRPWKPIEEDVDDEELP